MKPFRDQFKKCNKDGNLVSMDNYPDTEFPKKLLVCWKYKQLCSSKVCEVERIESGDLKQLENNIKKETDPLILRNLKEMRKRYKKYKKQNPWIS